MEKIHRRSRELMLSPRFHDSMAARQVGSKVKSIHHSSNLDINGVLSKLTETIARQGQQHGAEDAEDGNGRCGRGGRGL